MVVMEKNTMPLQSVRGFTNEVGQEACVHATCDSFEVELAFDIDLAAEAQTRQLILKGLSLAILGCAWRVWVPRP